MRIVLFAHPDFVHSQSMARFARMLKQSFEARGHSVQIWAPRPRFFKWVPQGAFSKWAGYVDQYLVFPLWAMRKCRLQPEGTLYVFTDQALGPWVPLVTHKPHVVHVHDLLALRSALGEVPENPTRWTGRMYQRYIRRGFSRARHFISISNKTRDDLNRYGNIAPLSSHVVYNGLNYAYVPLPAKQAELLLAKGGLPIPERGMLLHVSGNQWYKNVPGVIRIYAHYARTQPKPLPLWLVGDIRGEAVDAALAEVPTQGQVQFFRGLSTEVLHACYSLARAFLFPSLAEGFGWPLIEAQACGCPVITTDEAPMTEAAGPAARYLPRLTLDADAQAWAAHGAAVLADLLALPAAEAYSLCQQCQAWPTRFSADAAIEGYLRVYRQVRGAELGLPAA